MAALLAAQGRAPCLQVGGCVSWGGALKEVWRHLKPVALLGEEAGE